MIVNHAGQTFRTIRGLEFTYTIKQNKAGTLLGEMVIDRKEKTITRNTVLLAYEKGQELMESEGCVTALSSPVFFALPSFPRIMWRIPNAHFWCFDVGLHEFCLAFEFTIEETDCFVYNPGHRQSASKGIWIMDDKEAG